MNTEWRWFPKPKIIKDCRKCGPDEQVERKLDGLVRMFRCQKCKASLGDLTIGGEP